MLLVDEKIEVTSRELPDIGQACATCPFDMLRLRNQLELLPSEAACPRQRPFPRACAARKGGTIDANLDRSYRRCVADCRRPYRHASSEGSAPPPCFGSLAP